MMSLESDVHNIFEQLHFEMKAVLKRNPSGDYIVYWGQIGDALVTLKIVSKNNSSKVERFHKEIIVDSILKKSTVLSFVEVLETGQDEEYFWIVRQYLPGDSLAASPEKNAPLFSHKIENSIYNSNRTEITYQIDQNLRELRKIEVDFAEIDKNKELYTNRFHKDISQYRLKKIEEMLGLDLSGTLSFYQSEANKYLQEDNLAPCLGDCTPTNIIIDPNLNIYLSDFEWFCFDNYTLDMAYLWLFLWECPEWQEEIATLMLSSEQDKLFFRLSIIRIAIGWFDLLLDKIAEGKIDVKELRNNIWVKYLINAGISYDKLMMVKTEV